MIERLTRPGDLVFAPFSGRGTAAMQAAANAINPLSAMLLAPRLDPPDMDALAARLAVLSGPPFDILGVMVNPQAFTKTANCWGAGDNAGGTNANRIVLARRLP